MIFKSKFNRYLLMKKIGSDWKEVAHSSRMSSIKNSKALFKKWYPNDTFDIWVVKR